MEGRKERRKKHRPVEMLREGGRLRLQRGTLLFARRTDRHNAGRPRQAGLLASSWTWRCDVDPSIKKERTAFVSSEWCAALRPTRQVPAACSGSDSDVDSNKPTSQQTDRQTARR